MTDVTSISCPKCQTVNVADALFCDECGTAFESPCAHCGETNRRSAKFCKNCGGAIASASPQPPAATPVAASPTNLVNDRLLASRRFIEGERKRVTVLFADIRGSTSFIEKLDPEEVRKHFDPVLRVMMEAVHRYDGTVNQLLGDGIMALFGAPLAHQDHAVRACYAALAMQEQMRRAAEKSGAAASSLRIGIGINSGEVVVRSLTNDLNIDYSALGQTTHLAARMESLAGPGAIVITAETLREAEGFIEVKSLGAQQVKGFTSSIEAFEVIGATAARNRLQAAAARGLSLFVGRQSEMDFAQRLVERAAGGESQILAVVGEAGMGKSRMLQHFLERYVSSQWRVLEAPSVSYGKATPYFPVIELLRNYFSLASTEPGAQNANTIAEHVLRLAPSLHDAIPPLLALLDVLPSEPVERGRLLSVLTPEVSAAIARYDGLELQERRQRTFAALTELLLLESHRQPLLLVFEDLHWIDGETHVFLDALVESLPRGHIFLLVNYRPGYSHSWANKDYYSRLRLSPLAATGTHELLDSLLGGHADLASLKEILIKRTDGNPFFVEESVRSLVEAGVVTGTKGNYRPAVLIDNVRIPNTVQTVLAERIDRLPADEKQLLQSAAVIGVVVPDRLLRGVSDLPETELRRALANLQAAEFLYESALFPELEFKFSHALINEVVYGALLHERRTALHAKTMATLDALAGQDRGDVIEALARHAFQGEIWQQAFTYQRQAGAKAMAHSAFLEAMASYENGFVALKHLPDGAAKLRDEIDLHLDARNVLFLLGDLPRVGEHLLAAEKLAEALADEQRTARVLNFLNSYYGLSGDAERAIEIGKRALALNTVRADAAATAVTNYYLGAAYNKTGQYGEAIEALRQGMAQVDGALKHERLGTTLVISVICRSHMVQCMAATGDFSEGIERGEEGVRIAEEANHPASLIHMITSLGILWSQRGEFDQAIALLDRALGLCQSANIRVYEPFVASRLGIAYAHVGRLEEALRYLERGVDESFAAGRVAFLALSIVWLSDGYLMADRVDDAAQCVERAFDLAQQTKERGHQAWALKLRADVARRREQIEIAAEAYHQALALSEALAMRPLRAHCYSGLAGLHASAGAAMQARSDLTAAVEAYRSLGMTHWLEPTQAQLRVLTHE